MSGRKALVLAALMVCSLFAIPVGAAQSQPEGDAGSEANASGADVAYDEIGADLAGLAGVDPQVSTSDEGEEEYDERQQAAAEGARAGAELAQEQGVEVTQRQTQAAVDAAVRAAEQRQNVSVEQVQAAAKGSAHGALVQSQSVNVTQIQAGVYGGTAGAVSQSQEANVEQTQSAAYGGTHGAVAQHQRANVTQIQSAAIGASAGGTHAAAQTQRINVTQIQEAAQGGAYGSLSQVQQVSVTQIQAAAFGAAGGGAENARDADSKKIQEASMGAAKGALTQVQEVTVEQVQSAARGACKGSLTQVQEVSVTQIQRAATGAAEGAISQSQTASVVQIQSAAQGAAQGTVRQVQRVEIVQVQSAASGAAAGAARSAAQNQVVNVEQIQAAAAGAGEGAVIQIQQVNIIQVQTIAESAAGGALSQYQSASVVQIQSAARGASEGAISLTQRQVINIEQIQSITERAAADTAATAAQINIENDVTIYNYAKGASSNPDDGDDGDDGDRLRSLFASVEDEAVFLANPNDVAVTVTITSDGDVRTITLSPGESVTEQFDPGQYTLTAESEDGRDVELAGRDELDVSVGDQLQSLDATVDNQTVTVENPNDQRVTVFASQDGERVTSFEVPADWEVTRPLDPGNYTLTAETEDGQSVQVNGQDEFDFEVEPEPEPEPEAVDLNATVAGQNLTVENPSDTEVSVTAAVQDGENQTIDVGADATVTETLDPGNYTLTGDAEAEDREVLVNGQEAFDVTVNETDANVTDGAIDLNATVAGQNVTLENPSDTDVSVTAAPEDGENRTIPVGAGETVTEQFDPGNYTFTGETEDERAVLLNGSESLNVAIEGEGDQAPLDLDATVAGQNLTVENPGEVDAMVTASPEDGENRTLEVDAGDNVTETLDPGNYTLTGEAEDDDRAVLVDGQETFEFTVNETDANVTGDNVTDGAIDLNATVAGQNVTVENPSNTEVTVTAEDGESTSFVVPGGENVSEPFDPGTYTLTGEAEDREVLINGQEEFEFTINETDANVTGGNVTVTNVTDGNVMDTNVTEGNVTDGNVTDANMTDGNVTDDNVTVAPIDLNVSVDGQNVTIQNQNDTDVTVTADDGEQREIDVAADETITEPLEPGNYTLTGEAEDDRAVTLNGVERLNITVEAAGEPEIDRQLDSCTVIDQPGQYELTADVTGDDADTDACLAIRSDDVVLEGNGNVVSGDSEEGTVGIKVYNGTVGEPRSGPNLENVTVQDVTVENWGNGLELGESGEGGPQGVTLERVDASGNLGTGVSLTGVDGATLTEVEANDNQRGVVAGDTGSVTAENVTVRDNEGLEVDARQGGDLTATGLRVGPSATLDFESESVGLESVSEDELPALPEDAESTGSGVDVTGSEFDGSIESVQVRLAVDGTGEDGQIQLWRHDGNEWSSVVNETGDGDTIETEVTEEGTYAAVFVSGAAQLESLTAVVEGQNLTVTNPNEVPVEVTTEPETGEETTFTVDPGETTRQLDPGTYTVSAATTDGQSVPVNGEESVRRTIEEPEAQTETDADTEADADTETEADADTETDTPENESSSDGIGIDDLF